MPDLKNKLKFIKSIPFSILGIVSIIIVTTILLCTSALDSNHAEMSLYADAKFKGEYRIGNGKWQKLTDNQHISSTKGDVTLRGKFHLYTPNGESIGEAPPETPISFFMNHINVTVVEKNNSPYVMDNENPMFGDSSCGIAWNRYILTGSESLEIIIHNPHKFGNETAIDEMISSFSSWPDTSFKEDIINSGNAKRAIGRLFFVSAIVMFGVALFSMLIHQKSNKTIWMIGLVVLAASGYFVYSAPGSFFVSFNVKFNNNILILSFVLYLLFLSTITSHSLIKTKKVASSMVTILGFVSCTSFIASLFTDIFLYDTLPVWGTAQSITSIVLIGCLIAEFMHTKDKHRWLYLAQILPYIAFLIDVFAISQGLWGSGLVSEYLFVFLFIVALIMVWQIIPQNINMREKSQKLENEKNILEAELKESRVAIMLSQIKPHFIYNTLGTIERLCLKDSQKAFELVRNFSLYLRSNFSEFDNTTPIRFTEEMKHVQYYIAIEQTRFPDMVIKYDLQFTDFLLPALSVQPLVENSIKHGLMRLESGGEVLIKSYQDEKYYYIEVIDNGVGFNTNAPIDHKKHVGLNNISGRLNAMVNGELTIESSLNNGTKATIKIPKEGH